MFDDTKRDLKAFEARLASLRPRAVDLPSLACGRRAGGEAQCLPSPSGRGDGGEGRPVPGEGCQELAPALALTLSRGESEKCSNPNGHRFFCIHCGLEATLATQRRWPLATVTTLAAGLAAALILMISGRPLRVADQQARIARQVPAASSAVEQVPGDQFATAAFSSCGNHPADVATYLMLRHRALNDDVDLWNHSVAPVESPIRQPPVSYREQIDRLLKEDVPRGS